MGPEAKGLDLNEALRCYFGATPTGAITPYGMKERVRDRYGLGAAEVQRAIDDALEGLLELTDDVWMAPSFVASGEVAERRARARRPDFDDVVCRAIGNYVSFLCR
jgi:hypothetical protein